ncbi:MAG: laccase domain-containing protein, partial [Acidobacteria bacterium]|nr:laccase domain-containing protein [Acidobacteriota bacterium]
MPHAVFPESTTGAFATVAPHHAFTTRALSFRGEQLAHDWESLATHLATTPDRIVRVSQVHGRRVLIVTPEVPPPDAAEADAIVCTDPMRAVAVRVADCVPILLADRRHRVVAAIHAGWRGSC